MGRLSRPGLLASCFAAASLIALTSLFAQNLSPQKQREKTVFPFVVDDASRVDVNNIDMYVTNHGTFARDLIGGGTGGLFFPKGSVKTAIYSAGLSIGAMVNGELRVAIAEYNDEFGPGIMVGGTPDDPEDPRFRVYKITTGDGPGDPDWDAWPIADGAPDDGAGNPLLIGDQTLWAVFNDADSSLHIAGRGSTLPLGVEVQLTVIAYRWPNALANTIFLKYRIINKSANLLEDAYLYFWNDPDMGGYTDDLIGYDTSLDLGYVYNASNLDAVYQVAPPAVGYIMLQGPEADGGGRLGATAFHAQDNTNDPANAAEVYNIMQGLNNDGSQIIDPITGLPTTYMYSGDPVAGTGWLDESTADKRCALNAGPFTMAAGDTQEVVFAILIGQGENRLNSIEVLRTMVPELENTYNAGFPVPNPPNSDAAAVMIEQPPNGSNFQSFDPSATVAHLGWGTATFNAYYSITLAGAPEYQSTRNASSLAAGQTMHLEFDPWLPSTPGIYDAMLLASSAGDADAENDTLRAQIEIISPPAPVDLQLISRSAGEAVLSWQPPPAGGDIAGYNIYRSAVSGGPYTKLNGALLTELTFTDTTIPSETVYYVVILELVGGLESENSDELPVYPVMTVADSGLLLVNGVHWATYGQQIEDFYNAQMAGTLSFDFWDLFSGNPVGFDPLGEDSAPPPELFQQYKSVIWIGNNYAGDIDYWYESLAALKQYMLSGGNLLLATRRAGTFFDNVLSTSYANIDSWSGYATIGGSNPLVAIVPGLVDMPPGNGASASSLANMFLPSPPPSPAIISTFTPIFDWDDLDATIWKGGFRSELTGGGQFVFISGRPYRFDQAASQANYDYILVNWFDILCNPSACADSAVIFPTPEGGVQGDPVEGSDGDTVWVEIQIKDNPQEIGAFGFIVQVNPAQLAFISAEAGDLTGGFVVVDAQENFQGLGSGVITCGGFGTTPVPVGSAGSLIRLRFEVSCAEGETSEITIYNLSDDVVGLTPCCNRFYCVVCLSDGDVNNDGNLTPGDALCAFKTFLNGQTVPAECDISDWDCEVIAGDVNCDGTVTPGDALSIFQRFLDGDPPLECFAQAGLSLSKRSSRAEPYRLSLVQRTVLQSAQAGGKELIKLSLRVDHPEGLTAFGLGLSYPAEKLDFVGIQRTALTQEWIELDGRVGEPGELLIGGFNIDAVETVAAGDLFELTFASKGESIRADEFGIIELTDDISDALLSAEASGLFGVATVPTAFRLYQSYPNPFQGHSAQDAVIRFDLAGREAMQVELSIYNITGQLVRRLIAGRRTPGQYEISWNGRNDSGLQLPSGTYFYRLKAGDFIDSRYLSIVR